MPLSDEDYNLPLAGSSWDDPWASSGAEQANAEDIARGTVAPGTALEPPPFQSDPSAWRTERPVPQFPPDVPPPQGDGGIRYGTAGPDASGPQAAGQAPQWQDPWAAGEPGQTSAESIARGTVSPGAPLEPPPFAQGPVDPSQQARLGMHVSRQFAGDVNVPSVPSSTSAQAAGQAPQDEDAPLPQGPDAAPGAEGSSTKEKVGVSFKTRSAPPVAGRRVPGQELAQDRAEVTKLREESADAAGKAVKAQERVGEVERLSDEETAKIQSDALVERKRAAAEENLQLKDQQKFAQDMQAKQLAAYTDWSKLKVDKDSWWSSKTRGQKVLTVVGAVLGGMGGDGHLIEKAIDRDIQVQRANIEKKGQEVSNLSGMVANAYQHMGDVRQAVQFSRQQAKETTADEIERVSSSYKSKTARDRALLAASVLRQSAAKDQGELVQLQTQAAKDQADDLHNQRMEGLKSEELKILRDKAEREKKGPGMPFLVTKDNQPFVLGNIDPEHADKLKEDVSKDITLHDAIERVRSFHDTAKSWFDLPNTDRQRQEIAYKQAFQAYRHAMTGAGFSTKEAQDYREAFPDELHTMAERAGSWFTNGMSDTDTKLDELQRVTREKVRNNVRQYGGDADRSDELFRTRKDIKAPKVHQTAAPRVDPRPAEAALRQSTQRKTEYDLSRLGALPPPRTPRRF